MSRDIETLVLQMNADISKLTKQLDRAQGRFDKTANAIERRQRQLDKNLGNLGREMGNFARPVQLASTVALGAITALSYQAAKRAEAVSGAFDHAFRDMPQQAAKATAQIADEFGRLETDVKDNFTQLGGVVRALGVDANTTLSLVEQLQRRSLDMAAFKDVGDGEAFAAVISGITGETEPLKRFGVVLNETAVKAELLRLGFKGKSTEASEAAKVIARANIILRQTAEVQGQVAREADGVAEKEKRVRAEFNKAAEDFGRQFLPVAGQVLKWASDALKTFNDLPSGVQIAGVGLLALVAAGGPIMSVIKGFQALITAAVAARAAMAAVAGSSAAAGAAGGAAAGAGAGALARSVPVAAAGAAIVVGTAGFKRAPEQSVEWAQQQVTQYREAMAQARAEGDNARASRLEERLGRALSELSRIQGEADAVVQDAQNEVTTAVNAALAQAGDFGLTPDMMTGNGAGGGKGGGGGGGKAEANAAARQAEARDQLALQLAVDTARANGDEAAITAAERRQDLARLTAQYEAAGYADAVTRAQAHAEQINKAEDAAKAREAAEKQIDDILEGRRRQLERDADYQQLLNDQLFDRLGFEMELARVSGDGVAVKAAERRLFIEERTLEILRLKLAATEAEARAMAGGEFDNLAQAEDGRAAAGMIVDVLRSDGIWEEAGRRFKDAAWNGVEDIFSTLLSGLGKSNGGGGGIVSAIASLFTGKRATGGAVVRGQAYLTGERRPEVFVPNTSGTIIPSVQAAARQMQQSRANPVRPVIVQLSVEEGGMFEPRVRALSGEVAIQTTATGLGHVQQQSRDSYMRQNQRFG